MLTKIFNGAYLKRLDNIKQWQEIDVFKEESVSQHSYKVSVLGRILLEDLFGSYTQDPNVLSFKLKCVDAFLFHDWDETLILRDISHETKYNDFNGSEIRDVLDDFVRHKVLEEFGENVLLPYPVWTSSSTLLISNIVQEDTRVKTFCKLADWIALSFYVKRERELGNRGLEKQWLHIKEGLEKSIENVIKMLESEFSDYQFEFTELNNLIKNIYG